MLPELFIQQLKQSCDMERIVSGYLPLKKKGRYLVGLCPFHNEKSPSFNVYLHPPHRKSGVYGGGQAAGGPLRAGAADGQRPVGRTFDAEKASAGNQPRVGTVFPFLPDVRTGQTGV